MENPTYKVGDVIFYGLPLEDRPANPEKEWSGRITAIHSTLGYVLVEVLTLEFVGDEDEVSFTQIRRVEQANEDPQGSTH